jgi:cellulose synthase/poly-beta-1,6-N-acetylglucosamine synthase-like glycosyltransferase
VLVKNEAESIGKCLESLLANDYPSFRILICDGRSTDRTIEVIQGYAKKYSEILLHTQETSGCGAARQELMQFVTADYVAWTDGGSIVDRNWLRELIVPLLVPDEEVAASGGLNYIISNNSVLAQSLGAYPIGVHPLEATTGIALSLSGNNVCYKTEVLRENPWATSIAYGDDLEMALKLRQKGFKQVIASNAKAYMRTQENFKSLHNWIRRKARGEVTIYAQSEVSDILNLKTFVYQIKMALMKRLTAVAISVLLLLLIILTPYRIPLTIALSSLAALYITYLFKRRFIKKQLGEKIFKRTYLFFPLMDFLFISLYTFYIVKYSKSVGA